MSNWTPELAQYTGPRYIALAQAIGDAITRGELQPGARLPTRRDLAYTLGLSVNTISSAYLEAERRGWVTGEVGRGTFVRAGQGEPETRFFMDGRPSDVIDLSVARPCTDPSQIDLLRQALGRLARTSDFSAMLACRPVIGLTPHREAGARWLRRIGIDHARTEQVVVTNGCVHGMLVALATLTKPGDMVVTENLTDHGLISLASVLHFQLQGLAIDEHGIVPDAFEAACRGGEVKVLATTPTLNNPTCALMPEDRRRAIARIARAHGVAIVEDDVFRPLVAACPPPVGAFAPELSFIATSATKCSVSGLRTGWLLAPERMVPRLVSRVRTTTWMATPLIAELATLWIEDGTLSDMVTWQRRELHARQELLAGLLDGWEVAHHRDGINAWVALPGQWRADNFVDQARLRGVAVTSAEPFVVGRTPEPHAIRISVGCATGRDQLDRGLRQIRELFATTAEPALLNL